MQETEHGKIKFAFSRVKQDVTQLRKTLNQNILRLEALDSRIGALTSKDEFYAFVKRLAEQLERYEQFFADRPAFERARQELDRKIGSLREEVKEKEEIKQDVREKAAELRSLKGNVAELKDAVVSRREFSREVEGLEGSLQSLRDEIEQLEEQKKAIGEIGELRKELLGLENDFVRKDRFREGIREQVAELSAVKKKVSRLEEYEQRLKNVEKLSTEFGELSAASYEGIERLDREVKRSIQELRDAQKKREAPRKEAPPADGLKQAEKRIERLGAQMESRLSERLSERLESRIAKQLESRLSEILKELEGSAELADELAGLKSGMEQLRKGLARLEKVREDAAEGAQWAKKYREELSELARQQDSGISGRIRAESEKIYEQVGILAEDFDAMKKTVSVLRDELKAARQKPAPSPAGAGEVEQVWEDVSDRISDVEDELHVRFEALDRSLGSLATRKELEQKLGEQQKALEKLRKELVSLEAGEEGEFVTAEDFRKLEQKLKGISAELGKVDRVQELERKVQLVAEAHRKQLAEAGSVASRLERLESALRKDDIAKTVTKAYKEAAGLRKEIEELREQLSGDGIADAVVSLSEEVAGLGKGLAEVREGLGKVKVPSMEPGPELQEIRSSLRILRKEVEERNSRLGKQVGSLEAAFEKLSRDFGGIKSSVVSSAEIEDALDSRYTAGLKEIERLQKSMEKGLSELKAARGSLKEEVRKAVAEEVNVQFSGQQQEMQSAIAQLKEELEGVQGYQELSSRVQSIAREAGESGRRYERLAQELAETAKLKDVKELRQLREDVAYLKANLVSESDVGSSLRDALGELRQEIKAEVARLAGLKPEQRGKQAGDSYKALASKLSGMEEEFGRRLKPLEELGRAGIYDEIKALAGELKGQAVGKEQLSSLMEEVEQIRRIAEGIAEERGRAYSGLEEVKSIRKEFAQELSRLKRQAEKDSRELASLKQSVAGLEGSLVSESDIAKLVPAAPDVKAMRREIRPHVEKVQKLVRELKAQMGSEIRGLKESFITTDEFDDRLYDIFDEKGSELRAELYGRLSDSEKRVEEKLLEKIDSEDSQLGRVRELSEEAAKKAEKYREQMEERMEQLAHAVTRLEKAKEPKEREKGMKEIQESIRYLEANLVSAKEVEGYRAELSGELREMKAELRKQREQLGKLERIEESLGKVREKLESLEGSEQRIAREAKREAEKEKADREAKEEEAAGEEEGEGKDRGKTLLVLLILLVAAAGIGALFYSGLLKPGGVTTVVPDSGLEKPAEMFPYNATVISAGPDGNKTNLTPSRVTPSMAPPESKPSLLPNATVNATGNRTGEQNVSVIPVPREPAMSTAKLVIIGVGLLVLAVLLFFTLRSRPGEEAGEIKGEEGELLPEAELEQEAEMEERRLQEEAEQRAAEEALLAEEEAEERKAGEERAAQKAEKAEKKKPAARKRGKKEKGGFAQRIREFFFEE